MKKGIVCVFTIMLVVSWPAFASEMQPNREQLSKMYTGKVYSPYAMRKFPSLPLRVRNRGDAGIRGVSKATKSLP
jgi:hypothetical protein